MIPQARESSFEMAFCLCSVSGADTHTYYDGHYLLGGKLLIRASTVELQKSRSDSLRRLRRAGNGLLWYPQCLLSLEGEAEAHTRSMTAQRLGMRTSTTPWGTHRENLDTTLDVGVLWSYTWLGARRGHMAYCE